ncbi:MAG TPA: TonB-dependent receptor [Caldimonas sp.]|nr:TonB-dependent receptor [Caldimonas sp.]
MTCHLEAPRPSRQRPGRIALAFRFTLVVSLSIPIDAAFAADAGLAPVVITGTREPEAIGRSTADIVVIDADTIRNTSADSVEDLIRRAAGVQVVRNGGPGQSSGFFIRGASTNSTVVLVDGVRVGSATLGQAEFEALGLAQIERIEVLRGPASSLYGADAVGGVVQIFTRRGDGPPRWNAAAEVGGYRSYRGDVGASGATGPWDYALSLGHEQSRGVSAIAPGDFFGSFNPDRDGFKRDSGSLQLGYTPAAGHRIGVHLLQTRLDSQFDSAEFAPPTFAPDPSPDFRNRLTTRVASIDYRGNPLAFWTATLQGARAVDDLTSGGNTKSRFVTRREQATWQNALALGAGQQVVLAYEHVDERASADVFAGEVSRRNDAGVLGYSGTFGAHTLQADVRRDDNSAYGGNTTGRIGYAIAVGGGVKLRALAGTTFRAPTFNDLAFPGFGVPGIRPERGRSVEAGASWQGDAASLSATVYRNRVRDLIGFQPDRRFCPPDPAYDFGCAANTQRARLQGATFGATGRWRRLDLRASVDFLDAKDADSGARLPRRAAHQESAGADYIAGDWRFGAAALFVGSRPGNGVVLGGYGVLDLRVAWRPRAEWQVEARLANALDRTVEPVRDYRGLGRQAWLGVRYASAGL